MGQRTVERHLISLLDPSPGGKSLGNPRHRHTRRSNHLGQIMSRSLSLNIGPQGEDHFLGALLTETFEQFADAQMFRPDAIKRGEFSSQGMIASPENPGTLQRQDVGGRLDHTEFPSLPCLITTEGALLLLCEESAKPAGSEGIAGPTDGTGQQVRLGIGRSEHPESDPLGTTRADPGKTPQLLHQLTERLGIVERHKEETFSRLDRSLLGENP